MHNRLKIVFMGTPDFAVPCLETLAKEHDLVGVVTAPDRPAGRGRQARPTAIKEKAMTLGLNILQPEKLKAPAFINSIQELQADLFVVVAFRMLPEVVWRMPPLGCINLHASLLPDLRGAAPINWALLYGYEKTGVSTFFIEKEIDTGLVIEQCELDIEANDSAGTLHDKLMNLGAITLLNTVNKIAEGKIEGIAQSKLASGNENPAAKIFKKDGELDWRLPAQELLNKIRGLSPYPAAWTKIRTEEGTRTIKLFHALVSAEKVLEPGQILVVGTGKMLIGTGTLPLDILELQMEGKRRMNTGQFLMGAKNLGSWNISMDR